MSSTLGELIQKIGHALNGFDLSKDAVAELTAAVDADDLALTLDAEANSVGRGVYEVEMELMRVKSWDATSNTATLYSFGRGYRGSVPAAHAAGAEVRINPSWPNITIARAINEAIEELYPQVYAVVTETTTIDSTVSPGLLLEGEPTAVLSVFVQDTSFEEEDAWIQEPRWDFNKERSENGRDLVIGGLWPDETVVKVVYATRPGLFSLNGALSQDFVQKTGLQDRHEGLLLLAVAYKLAPFIDVSRLSHLAAEARSDADAKSSLTGASTARLLYSMFKSRLDQEAQILAQEHPIRLHMTR